LALIEAVDNAIFHAHRRRARLPIDIVLAVDERRVRVEVGDRGKGFELDSPERPEALATSGRGLFLIKSMVDKVESVRRNGIHWIRMTCEI
jgi:anti-sigma regulatory factor (Ser/Thr protein kinase)